MCIIWVLPLGRGTYLSFLRKIIISNVVLNLNCIACNTSVAQTNLRLGRRSVQVGGSGKTKTICKNPAYSLFSSNISFNFGRVLYMRTDRVKRLK